MEVHISQRNIVSLASLSITFFWHWLRPTDNGNKYDDKLCLNTGWPISWRTWVGLTLILGVSPGWWAATVATYCLSRMEEHPKCKSTKPSPPGDGPPCTHHSILMYAHILPNHLHPYFRFGNLCSWRGRHIARMGVCFSGIQRAYLQYWNLNYGNIVLSLLLLV